MSELVRYERDEEGIGQLQLCDEAGRNTLSHELVHQLEQRAAEAQADPELKVCVVRGLEDVFCAGAQKEMLEDLAHGRVNASDIMLSRAVLEIPVPTIAALQGHAIGGGLMVGLCCDIVILARESRYGCSFMNMGFTPGMGTTRILQMAVGDYIAAEMMYGGQPFRGSRFVERSQINYVLPKTQVVRKAQNIAARIAEKPRFALELLKRSLSLPKRQAFEEARSAESTMHQLCFSRPETQQLIAENYISIVPREK